jgi:hypothetical protein
MTDDEYERLVHDRDWLGWGNARAPLERRKRGGKNTIIGASRFAHQIDVSVRAESFLVLVECKYWSRPVHDEAVLVLPSDLRISETPTRRWRFEPPWFSMKACTKGARVLAAYFGISLDVVSSIQEYGVRPRNQVFASLVENVSVTDWSDAEVSKGKGV